MGLDDLFLKLTISLQHQGYMGVLLDPWPGTQWAKGSDFNDLGDQMQNFGASRRFIAMASTSLVVLAATGSAFAQQATQSVSSASSAEEVEQLVVRAERNRAVAAAPSKSTLEAVQPQSIVSRTFIDAVIPETGDFVSIANITPSASGVSYNGPGLSEGKVVMRGFQDGEYNVTFDGIAFGDTNDPTHHSTAYFPKSTIGQLVVDRGPGAAGDLGQANFGGAIHMFSRTLKSNFGFSQSGTIGSWNTMNLVTELQSGEISQMGGLKLGLTLQEGRSAGALTNSRIASENQALKAQLPLFEKYRLTLFTSLNHNVYNQADSNGATLAQVAQYGKSFGLNNDPKTPQYAGYNRTRKMTDFTYVRFEGPAIGGFTVDNTLYSYAYINRTLSALDVTDQTPLGTKAGPKGNLDVAGYTKLNLYRVYGDIVRLNRDFSFGTLKVGGLYEVASTKRALFDLDLTLNVPDKREKGGPGNIQYFEHSGWDQYQLFADFDWRPFNGLTVTPGIKYVSFKRNVDADVGSKTFLPTHTSATYDNTQYFLTANYRIQSDWSVYAQYATGFLIPPLKAFYVPNTTLNDLKPQTSTNYQLGTVFQRGHFTLDADVYQVDFKNKFIQLGSGATAYYTNMGGAQYKGVEAQAAYAFDFGLSVFANGSVNSAKDNATNLTIAKAPKMTAAFGALYRSDKIEASLIHKITGDQWAVAGEASAYKISAYDQTDLTLAYKVTSNVKAKLGIYNLLNNRDVTGISTGKTAAGDQYFFQPPRSYQVTLSAAF